MNNTIQEPQNQDEERTAVEQIVSGRKKIEEALSREIIGQKEAIEQILIALFSGGHSLLIGAPGLAKTLMVKCVSQVFELDFRRIQFTPDLMPADITGTEILTESGATRELQFVRGPVFANVLLADEINRTPPKTQAALLEAMQEHQVTVGGKVHSLPNPFFVLATQNPIEMEGTYPLPEAQLDRFLFNIQIDYLPEDEEVRVVSQTTTQPETELSPIFDGEDILRFQHVAKKVPVSESVVRYAVRLASHSRPGNAGSPDFVNQWVNWGAGLRAGQALIQGAKVRALFRERVHVTPEDVDALTGPVLRHRILLNYRAEAEGVTVSQIIQRLVEETPVP